jgi:hypothetical protein
MQVTDRIATETLVSHEVVETGVRPHKTFKTLFTYESGLVVSMDGAKGGNWQIVHDPKA